jgi:hypothetical protein
MRTRTDRSTEVVDDRDVAAPVATDETVARRRSEIAWSPAQIISMIVGIGFIVLGIAAVAKTGSSHLYTPRMVVWHLGHTPLLAWIEIAFGVLAVIAAVAPGGIRWLMGLLGAAALAAGIVVLVNAAPYHIHQWFDATHTNGWLYVAVGGALLLSAMLAPVFFVGRSVDVRRDATVRT